MDLNLSNGSKLPSQEHLNFINKLNDAKIPRQSQLIANRLFMKNFPRETTGAEIEHFFQTFGPVHDVKIIAKENTHFAFISFVNESTALDVLRQHAIVPLAFQNRPIILAPAYKKNSISSLTSPTSYYPGGGSAITPPPTPSRSAVNGFSQQSSTPYHHYQQQQQQQQTPASLSGSHPMYPPIFFPMQANMPFVPMTGTYFLSPGPAPGHPQQIPASFYPTFYSQGSPHQSGGPLMNRHAYIPSPYLYSMGPATAAGAPLYPSSTTGTATTATASDISMSSDY